MNEVIMNGKTEEDLAIQGDANGNEVAKKEAPEERR